MTLRTLLGACAAATVASIALPGSTRAADIPPVTPVYRAPAPVAVAAPPSWYGFYIGVQGGYGWGSNAIAYTPDAIFAPAIAAGTVAGNPRGFVGGIAYGSNYQFGSIVLGEESDISYSNIRRRETIGAATGQQRMEYFSTTRVRAGYLVTDQWLLYGTGGLANAGVESLTTFNLVAPAACAGIGNCPSGRRWSTLWGWTAGGGLELASGPWSLKVEYLYYDLGKLNYNAADPTLPGAAIAVSNRFSGNIVRGGINYRFNWTLLDLVLGRR